MTVSSSSSSGEDGGKDAFSSTTTCTTSTASWIQRRDLLHERLEALGMMSKSDTNALYNATMQSIENPMQGYYNHDNMFGKSAIKTYKSFLFPKNQQKQNHQQQVVENEDEWRLLSAMAARTAQQIDFLCKRHRSHETPWIRHHDGSTTAATTTTYPRRTTTTFPIILLLDNVRSAMNVGSLFRTADAAGCAAVWTTGITPHPHGNGADKLRKAALGAELVIPSRHFVTTLHAIQYARQQQHDNDGNDDHDDRYTNYTLVGMETTSKSVDYTKVVYPDYTRMKKTTANNSASDGASSGAGGGGGIVLVLGNEVTGIDVQVLNQLDIIVEIPMFGVKNSLNVAACAPIVIYEILRQWNNNNKDNNDE